MYICSFPLYVYIYIIIFDINVNLTKIQQKMKRMFDKTSNGINLMKKKNKKSRFDRQLNRFKSKNGGDRISK